MAESFVPYGPALCWIAALALTNAVQNIVGGGLKNGIEGQPAGQRVSGDMHSFAFRAVRTYMNGVETLPSFFAAAFAAIMLGVDAWWVNGVALTVFISRMAYWSVYYAGIGGSGFGIRSVLYVFAPLGAAVLGAMAFAQTTFK